MGTMFLRAIDTSEAGKIFVFGGPLCKLSV